MRWRTGRRSNNIEDRRGETPRQRVGMPGGIKLGGGAMILVVIFALVTGQNPLALLEILGGMGGGQTAPTSEPRSPQPRTQTAGGDEQSEFVSTILADTEDTWGQIFASYGEQYRQPQLVLFSDMVQSVCGLASAASGPFYCPGDQKVYLDLSFFRELARLGAPGDFAQAYVIAHEIAHHVQTLVGTEAKVSRARSQATSQEEVNQLSVLMELQADCYAGVWANHADNQRQILEPGDVEEGLTAAASIGDDRLQQMAGRSVQPDSFTHGSSEQRVRWFRTGMQSGDMKACDTFAAGG
jgi:predicted metalloprotease